MILLTTRAKALWVWENLSCYSKIQPVNPRGCLKSLDQNLIMKCQRRPSACVVSDKRHSEASDGNWGLDCKPVEICDEQQKSAVRVPVENTNSQSLLSGLLAGVAKLFHRRVLTGQSRFLLGHGIKMTFFVRS